MKKILLLGFVFLSLFAQSQTKKEKQLVDAVEKLRIAMIDGNRTALESLVSDKLSYGHSSGLVENKTEFVNKIVNGLSDFVTIDLSEQNMIVQQKTAIVRHILKAKTNDSGKPGEVNLRVMLVYQKENGSWKLLARQAVKIT